NAAPTGGGPTPCDGLTGPSIVLPDTVVTSGEIVCIPVYGYELIDLIDFTFGFDYDPAKLSMDSLINIHPLLTGVMLNPVNGRMLFSEANGMEITIPNCDTLFELCVTGLGAGNTTDLIGFAAAPAPEFNTLGGQFAVGIVGSTVTINAAPTGGGPTPCDGLTGPSLVLPDTVVTSGEIVCIPVYGYELIDLIDFTFGFDYDPAKLSMDSLINIHPLLTGVMLNPVNGRMLFSEANGMEITIPNCDTLFELCMTGLGAGNTTDLIGFAAAPAPEFNTLGGPFAVGVVGSTVTINPPAGGGPTLCDGLTMPTVLFPDSVVVSGEGICLPVIGYQLADLNSFAFQFDYTVGTLTVDSVIGIHPLILSGFQFVEATSRVLYQEPGGLEIDFPDCDTLFHVCVSGTGPGNTTSPIGIAPAPVPEFNSITGPFVVDFPAGTITVNPPNGGGPTGTPCDFLGEPSVIITPDTGAVGDIVCLPILAFQLADIVSFAFELNSDSTIARFVDTMDVHPLISGNGFLFNTLNGQTTRFLWSPPGVNPEITIDDCDTLFKVCYELVGVDLDSTGIVFGTGIPPEFNNSGGNLVDSLYDGFIRIEGGLVPCDPIVITEGITFPLCNGDSNGEIDVTVTGGDGMNYTFSWADGPTTEDRTGLAAGTYTVTVTSCTETNTKSIIVGDRDVLTAPATITDVLCNGGLTGEIDLDPMGGVAPYDYDWTGFGVVNGIQDQEDLPAGMYSVTLTDDNLCTVTNSFTISEENAIIINGLTTNPSGGMNNGEINITVTGGAGGFMYSWIGTGVVTNDEDQTGLDAGNYAVTVEDLNGCTATEPFTLTRNAPSVVITSTPSCAGASTGTITTVITGGRPPYTLSWSGGLPPQLDHTGVAPGTYDLTLTDADGVIVMQSVTVGTHPAIVLTADITPSDGTDNGAIDLMVNGMDGGPYTYVWDDGPITEDRTGLAAGQYTVTVTDPATGCTQTDTYDVPVESDMLSVIVEVTGVQCNAANSGSCDGELSISIVSSAVGDITATFTNAGAVGLPATAILTGPGPHVFNGLCPGTFDVQLIDFGGQPFSSTGLEITEPTEIEIIDFVIIPVVGNGAANGGVDITPSGGTLPYSGFQWNAGPNPMNEDNLGLITGSYDVTITDANGCEFNSSPFIVGQFELFNVNVVGVTCASELNGSIDISVRGAVGPFTYLWSNGAVTQDLVNVQAGTYTVTVTDTRSLREITGTYEVVSQSNLLATAQVISNFNGFQVSCIGQEDATIEGFASGGSGNTVLTWNTGFVGNPLTGVGAGTYWVEAQDDLGCISRSGDVIVSDPDPMLADIRADNIRCAGEENGRLTATITGGAGDHTYEWFDSTGEFLSGERVAPRLSAGTYTLIVTDDNGCTQTFTAGITEPIPMTVTATVMNATQLIPGSIQLNIAGGTQPYVISWEGRDETTDRLGPIPFGTYTYSVTDVNGCEIITDNVRVANGDFECLVGSVVITPATMDGLNDLFMINCIEDHPDNTVEVFNRWGQIVYEDSGYDNVAVVFDGRTRSGEVLPEGGYFFVLRYRDTNGDEQIKKGSLNLLR
ncbi:MAG: gliding motility-associated C-terminal domain-containing protein, partial [Saprospiraceae bacterium]